MRKREVARPAVAGIVAAALFMFTPLGQLLPREIAGKLIDWWPLAGLVLLLGLLLDRYRPGRVARLIAAVGLAWVCFLVFFTLVFLVVLALLALKGGIGP